jgi:hypothetical protein
MSEMTPLERTIRHDSRFLLGRLGRLMHVVNGTYQPEWPYTANPYEAMAEAFYAQLGEHAKEVSNFGDTATEGTRERRAQILQGLPKAMGVRHGFMVTARTLSFAPAAYHTFALGQGVGPSIDGLRSVLNEPASFENTVHRLANMSHGQNKAWEYVMGLVDSGYAHRDELNQNPFMIEARQGQPHLVIEQATTFEALQQGRIDGVDFRTNPERTCPAKDVFLPKLWGVMIEECAQPAGLFEQSLQTLQGGPLTDTSQMVQ